MKVILQIYCEDKLVATHSATLEDKRGITPTINIDLTPQIQVLDHSPPTPHQDRD